MARAQCPDGYMDTYFIIKEPHNRWKCLRDCHELYCAGHILEAAVAYYKATGKRRFLDVMKKYMDYILTVFGTEEGKLHGYPGHEEIELALCRLYDVTGEKKYLDLAQYFINQRGTEPNYFIEELKTRGDSFHWDGNDKQGMEYFQANQPVRRQKDAVGHSVRAVYLYSGMADVAMRTQDESLKEACRTLFRSIAEKRMYVTGGIGSTYNGEAFTFDYDLPNDTAYAESCASIGLIFFMQRMLEMDGDAVYGDVMERALYNTVLSGMGLDGKAFFYVNPLEVFPEADLKDPNKHHVKIERQKWFACACCPPNIARLLADLGQYIYRKDENGVAVDLFIGSEVKVSGGVTLTQNSQVPFGGKVNFKLSCPNGTKLTLRVRKPFWTDGVTCDAEMTEKNGYLVVEKVWNDGDTVSFDFAMPVRRVYASPYVRQDLGKVCLMRGPLVYCLEEADNGNNLHLVSLPEESEIAPAQGEGVLSGMTTLKAKGLRIVPEEGTLYRGAPCRRKEETQLTFIPYFAWANRGVGEMTVWVRE